MADDLVTTLKELRAAAAAFDNAGVEDGIMQLEWFTDDDGTWGVELFAAVKSLLDDAVFLNAGQSYRLVSALELDWNELSERQHAELRPLLTAAFDKYGDWLGSQLTADIFAERYADEAAYDTLARLSRTAAHAPARALAAYGIGRLARTLERGPMYDRAIAALNELCTSTEEYVAQEARDALVRLSKRE